MHNVRAFTERFIAQFTDPDARVSDAEIERIFGVLRPISADTYAAIGNALNAADNCGSYAYGMALTWLEANFVVSPEQSDEKEWAITLLAMDPCPGVVRLLPEAITHAQAEVDERIRLLLAQRRSA
jgi:hypothetical protein